MGERGGSDLRERARPLARPENFGRFRDSEGLSTRNAGIICPAPTPRADPRGAGRRPGWLPVRSIRRGHETSLGGSVCCDHAARVVAQHYQQRVVQHTRAVLTTAQNFGPPYGMGSRPWPWSR